MIKYVLKILLMCNLLLWGVNGALAQESQPTDTLPHLPVFQTSWLELDVGWNQFYFRNAEVDYTPLELNALKSMQFSLAIFRQRASLYQQKINIQYAFAFEFNRFEFSNPYTINGTSSFVSFDNLDTLELERNRLRTTSIIVPLLLEYESKPRKKSRSFRAALGGYAGLKFNDKVKIKEKGKDVRTFHGDFKLPELKFGIQSELGFSYVTLYYRFDLLPLFRLGKSSGYTTYPMSFGFRITPFL